MITKLIKAFVDDNIEKIVAHEVTTSNYNSLTFRDTIYFNINENEDFSNISNLRKIYMNHRVNFKKSLDLIKENNFELKDVSESTKLLYKKNLDTFLQAGENETRFKFLLETVPILKDYESYKNNPEIISRFSDIKLQELKNLENLSGFSRLVEKLNRDKKDIGALLDYMTKCPESVARLINTSKKFRQDITSSSDYPELIERLATMLDPLTLKETITFFEFANLQPKLSFLLIHPSLIFVLGNILFLKFFLPLIASSTIKGPLYNWSTVREDIQKKIYQKKWVQRSGMLLRQSYDFVQQNRSTLVTIVSSAYLAARALNLLLPQTPTVNEQQAKLTYKEIVDRVPRGAGLEQYGINLNPVRGLIVAVFTEIGRTASSVSEGIVSGSIDRVRPAVEKIAEVADDITKKKK